MNGPHRVPQPLSPSRAARNAAAAGRWPRRTALAPLALAALLAMPAQAQEHCDATDPYELWCATMTVGSADVAGRTFIGFKTDGPAIGSLAPRTFTRGEERIQVVSLLYSILSGNQRDLGLLVTRESGHSGTDVLLGSGYFALEIGSGESQKSFVIHNPSANEISFSNHGLSWSNGDSVPVRLVVANAEATGRPAISGTAQVGHTLTAGVGDIDDANGLPGGRNISYQWILVDGTTETAIVGATARTWRVDRAHRGKQVKVRLSFVDNDGFNESRTSDAYPVSDSIADVDAPDHCEPLDPNEIWCGVMTVGEYTVPPRTLRGYSRQRNSGSLTPNKFRWRTAEIEVVFITRQTPGTAGSIFFEKASGTTPSDGLLGNRRFSLEIGTGTNKTTVAIDNPGTAVSQGISHRGSVWAIGEKVPVTLRVTPNTPATGKPAISGTATAGETLTASTGSIADADGIPADVHYLYTWQRVTGGVASDIANETDRTYTLQKADEGKTVQVKISFTDGAGNDESRTSDAYPSSGTVAAAGKPDLVSATVGGAALKLVYDARLDTGSVPAGTSFDVEVAGADRNLSGSDPVGIEGRTVTLTLASAVTAAEAVTVAYTKPGSNPLQSVSGDDADSLAATTVSNVTLGDATGKPRISGSRIQGRALYASTRDIRDADGFTVPSGQSGERLVCGGTVNGSCAFQWLRVNGSDDAEIAGATGRTYRTVAADVGKRVKVRVSFTDANSERETVTSEAFPSGTRTIEAGPRPRARATGVAISGPGDDNLWTENEAIEVTVTLSQAVRVSAAPDRTRLFCLTDRDDPDRHPRLAHYVGGSGTDRLTFRCRHRGEATTRVAVERDSLTVHGSLAGAGHDYDVVRESNPAATRTGKLHGMAGPTIASLAMNDPGSDGVWEGGSRVEIKVTFSEAVDVITTGGTPYARVRQVFGAGGSPQFVDLPYERVEGGDTVVFARTAAGLAGRTRLAYEVDADALASNRGVIVGAATGAVADLSHAALAGAAALVPPCGTSFPGEIWCATMTVGEFGAATEGFDSDRSFGSLSNAQVSYSGESFTIWQLYHEGTDLRLNIDPDHWSNIDTAGFELRLGPRSYAFPGRALGSARLWAAPHPGWSVGDRVTARLVGPAASAQQVAADPPAVDGAPAVSGADSGGSWAEGGTVRVALVFSEAVDVDTSGGTPSIGIGLGGTEARSAAYESGSGTAELVFAYTLVAGDGSHTAMGVTPNSLALNGATVSGAGTGLDAALAHEGGLFQGARSRGPGPAVAFRDVPERHDGSAAFTVGLRFAGAPAGLVATVRVSGRVVVAKSPSWLRRTETPSPPVGAAFDRVTVKLAVPPSSIGEAAAAMVAVIDSSSRTTTSALPGSPTE